MFKSDDEKKGPQGILPLVGEGKSLDGFKIIRMTELIEVGQDGSLVKSLGFYSDTELATYLCRESGPTSEFRKRDAFIFTNGNASYLIDTQYPVVLMDSKEERLRIWRDTVGKLSPEALALFELEAPT